MQAQLAAPSKKLGRYPTNHVKSATKQKVSNKTTVGIKKKTAHFKQNEFVLLCQLLLDNAFVFNEFGDNTFDSTITARILAIGETEWAFGRLATNRSSHKIALATAEPERNLVNIQPLNLALSPFTIFSNNSFRPLVHGRFVLTADDAIPFNASEGYGAAPVFEGADGVDKNLNNSTELTARSPFVYTYAMDKHSSVNAGVGWISDLGDTKRFLKTLEEPGDFGPTDKTSGVDLRLGACYKAFTFTGGYIRALDARTATELAIAGKESDPTAWNSEIAYTTELLHRETTLAVGYQKASDTLQYFLPEERYNTKASMTLSQSTTFSLEYYQDKDNAAMNGTEGGYGITTKIGFDF